mgnify:CR=1 FL=1
MAKRHWSLESRERVRLRMMGNSLGCANAEQKRGSYGASHRRSIRESWTDERRRSHKLALKTSWTLQRRARWSESMRIRWAKRYADGEAGVRIVRGYVWVFCPEHPRARKGYVKRSRLVLEHKLGRQLATNERIHHRDGNKTNDKQENLIALSPTEHACLHGRQYRQLAVLKRIDRALATLAITR